MHSHLLRGLLRDAIETATREVFETMLASHVTRETAPCAFNDTDVVSFVGLTGNWSGTGTVSCGPAMARLIAVRMLLLDPDEALSVDDEVLDAVAELTNMVVGNIKSLLSGRLGEMAISIPTVVYGRNFRFRNLSGMPVEAVIFQFEEHRFEVKICLAQTSEQNSLVRTRLAEPAISAR